MLTSEIVRKYRVSIADEGGLDVTYSWHKQWYYRNIPLMSKFLGRLTVKDTEWIRFACTGDPPESVCELDKQIREANMS